MIKKENKIFVIIFAVFLFLIFVLFFGGKIMGKTVNDIKNVSELGLGIKSKLVDPSIMTDSIQLKNGYWTNYEGYVIDEKKAKKNLASYKELNDYLSEQGIDFLYCYPPNKECKYDNQLPNGIISYTNDNIDMYIKTLSDYGVNNLDLREYLHDDNIDHYSMFYKTDHHWNVKAGKWAASVIEEKLSKDFGVPIQNVNDMGDYKTVVYENYMFGSIGNNVSRYVAEPEDFEIIYPDFETKFRFEIPSKDMDVEGPFEEVFVDQNVMDTCINSNGGYAYGSIIYGDRPIAKITNLNNSDGPKIFVIRDSFSNAVIPYLALSCSEIIMVDTREGSGNFQGDIIETIDSFNPDIVLAIQHWPQSLNISTK